jgi:UDP-N-acetylglucosamine--N-acetylmuramyl-(pentapeptide) pyrophosphoryl-undecaprenol N-acetylglucosamine transferase
MKIIIACGGTGGHIFPGISLYRALKKKRSDVDILLITDRRAVSTSIITEEIPHIFISILPLRFEFNLQNTLFVLKLFIGIFQSLRILLRFKPDVVVGFGGYASFSLVFFARFFRIRTVIHEQNVKPGRANLILSYIVDKIAVGFIRTKNYFDINASKVKFTGNPLRQDLVRIEKFRACEYLGLPSDKFIILVTGGSQGAHKINIVFLKTACLITDRADFGIVHLCGEHDRIFLEQGYKDLSIKARVFTFFQSMEYAYSAADIVVSRAGATTISEICFFGLPSILIPYPFVHRHQIKNAAYLCENNAAYLIEERGLYPEMLKGKILELFNNADLRKSMGRNALMFSKPKADEALTEIVLNDPAPSTR